jgi:membrane-associated phospholipid phosphatase
LRRPGRFTASTLDTEGLATLPSVVSKVWRFVRRHRWSLPLAGGSLLSFIELAEEMREGEVAAFDAVVASNVTAWRGSLDWPMVALTRTGEAKWMTLACIVAVIALVLLRKRREGAFVAACGIAAGLLSTALKLVFQRTRPEAAAGYLIDLPSSFSFPSGHAMGSASVAGSLAIVAFAKLRSPWRWLALVAAFLYIVGVGVSRVYLGVHFASDVLGGQLASAAVVAAMTGWFFPRLLPGEATKHPAPSPASGA